MSILFDPVFLTVKERTVTICITTDNPLSRNIANQILPWDVVKRKKKQPLYLDKRIRSYLSDLTSTTPGTLDHIYISHLWTQSCYRFVDCYFWSIKIVVLVEQSEIICFGPLALWSFSSLGL